MTNENQDEFVAGANNLGAPSVQISEFRIYTHGNVVKTCETPLTLDIVGEAAQEAGITKFAVYSVPGDNRLRRADFEDGGYSGDVEIRETLAAKQH